MIRLEAVAAKLVPLRELLIALLAIAGMLVALWGMIFFSHIYPERASYHTFHIAAYPGAAIDDVLAELEPELGPVDDTFEPGPDAIEAFYSVGGYHPRPAVQGWSRAYAWRTNGWVMHVVYVDAHGRVVCAASSRT